jgi:hypothetical protein
MNYLKIQNEKNTEREYLKGNPGLRNVMTLKAS